MSELRALRERVEKAEWPMRELDARIWCALVTDEPLTPAESLDVGDNFQFRYTDERAQKPIAKYVNQDLIPEYTASIDAAVGLIEQKLPERDYTITVRRVHPYMGEYPFEFTIWGADKYHQTDGASAGYNKYSICLAAIAALLNALENDNESRRKVDDHRPTQSGNSLRDYSYGDDS